MRLAQNRDFSSLNWIRFFSAAEKKSSNCSICLSNRDGLSLVSPGSKQVLIEQSSTKHVTNSDPWYFRCEKTESARA